MRSLRRAVAQFAVASGVIMLVAPRFAVAAEGIAVTTGIGTTFVGTWLVGLSTSLPELVTSRAAVRLRVLNVEFSVAVPEPWPFAEFP